MSESHGSKKTRGPLVGILMGSDSDLPVMQKAADVLADLGIGCEVRVSSAHRTPDDVAEYARSARERGLKAIIAGAGGAAHLAGVIAAYTTLPVIAVPVAIEPLRGLDSLLSMVQMPSGIPVATVAIGGATNAGLLAAQSIGTSDEEVAARLATHRAELAESCRQKNRNLLRDKPRAKS